MSISNYLENELLDAVFNAGAFSVTDVYIKLHIGDPGEDGTGNPAAETTRKVATWGAAAAGAVANDAAVEWTNVSTTETYSHVSLWDAATVGNCLWTGAMTASKAVTAGDTFRFPIGDIDVTLD